jgi:hypothetical protein
VRCGVVDLIGSIASFTQLTTFGRRHHSFTIVYYVALHRGYIQMKLFFRTPKWKSQIGFFIVLKFWTFVFFSNQDNFEHARTIFYNFQKYFFDDVWHAPIRAHFTLVLKGFVIKGQIPILTSNPSFNHNSCISSINEQCKGTLSIYTLELSNNILGVWIGACLPFQLRL